MTVQLAVTAVLGVTYRFQARHLPADQRVSAVDFLPMAIVFPVSYAILTPLALLTLDSGKWETRGHQVPVAAAAPVIEPQPAPVVAHSRLTPFDSAARRTRRRARVASAAAEKVVPLNRNVV
jgi:hypothetical protein